MDGWMEGLNERADANAVNVDCVEKKTKGCKETDERAEVIAERRLGRRQGPTHRHTVSATVAPLSCPSLPSFLDAQRKLINFARSSRRVCV